jgi:hypothetical protein
MRYIGLGLVFTLCFASCKKKSVDPFSYEGLLKKNSGVLLASINGKPWMSNIVLASYGNDGKHISIHSAYFENGLERQSLNFNSLDPTRSNQTIYSNFIHTWGDNYISRNSDSLQAAFYLSQGDAEENSYQVIDSGINNYFHIDSYNPATTEISGSFQVAMYRWKSNDKPRTQGFPDTLRIADGKFSVRLMNYN